MIRGALKRKLRAGATNLKEDKNKVSFTLEGDNEKIIDLVNTMKSGKVLNSWGAKVCKCFFNSSIIFNLV